MLVFGIDYICLCNFIGFFFKNVDKAFKNSIIIMSILGFIFPNANLFFDSLLNNSDSSGKLSNILNWLVFIISPYTAINESLSDILFLSEIANITDAETKAIAKKEYKYLID